MYKIILILFLLTSSLFANTILSKEEQNYLVAKKNLSICVDPDWMPFDGIKDSKHTGLASDYMKNISKIINTPIKLMLTSSWKETMQKAKNKECDIIPIISKTKDRESYLNFTSSYLDVPIVISTKNDKNYIDNITNILDKKIAVVKNYSIGIYLKNDYDNIHLVEVDSITEGLKKVESGEVYAYIDNLASINYEIRRNFQDRVKISGRLDRRISYHMGTRADEPILNKIMQKSLRHIDNSIKNDIYNRWVSNSTDTKTDYSLVRKILLATTAIFLIIIYRHRELNKFNEQLKKDVQLATKDLDAKNIQLQKSIDNFKNIFDMTKEMIIITDEKGIIVDVNRSGLTMMGYENDKQSVIGANLLTFADNSSIDDIVNSMKQEVSDDYLVLLTKKDNSKIQALANGRDIIINNKKMRLSSLLDITSIKQRDDAISASNAKSEFLANMSHEIRTPLNAIIGFIDILKKDATDKKTIKYLDIVKKSSNNLLQIIEDILDFSKIQSGKLLIDRSEFNVQNEFELLVDLFKANCDKKSISLHLELSENLPSTIISDSLRIKQVITNLISNAVKFTPNGKNIYVLVNYDNTLLNVTIKDEGIGIASDKLEHIFEAFNQEDSGTTKQYGGTGLGLSISSSLIKLLGGELNVKSEQGGGSEFYFAIPVEIGEKKTKIEICKQIDNFHGEKILLVEDNKTNQIFMGVVLDNLNLDFEIASDGEIAFEMFKENSYDLILMDENMPNKNGIQSTQDIRKYENEHKLIHTPIIALTANALKGDRERFLDAGMDEYLSKPIDLNILTQILNKFLKTS